MSEEVKVNPEVIDKHADRVDVKPVQDAKGPAKGSSGHSFCFTCNRVVFSIWKYGPVTPAQYNRTYCICNGRWEGWDADEIERNKYDALTIYLEEQLKQGKIDGTKFTDE